jgi:HSP20 family protein
MLKGLFTRERKKEGGTDMATETAKTNRKEAGKGRETLINRENSRTPDTDIFENDEYLRLIMDVPGVEKGGVQIEVDENDTLQVRAKNGFKEPDGGALREFEPADYFRSFYLGQEYAKDSITAKLENGVLELTVPKREEVRPRRISINA